MRKSLAPAFGMRAGRLARLTGLLVVVALIVSLVGVVGVDGASAAVLPIRPDARIKLVGDTSWIGGNVYNATGAGQVRATTASPGGKANFAVSIQNDGRAGSFRVRGSGSTGPLVVTYRYGGAVVTGRVVSGTFALNSLPHGATRTLNVSLALNPAAVVGSTHRATVTVSSVANPTKKDVVRARVTTVAPPNRAPAFPVDADMHWWSEYIYNTGFLVAIISHLTVSACVDPDGDPVTYLWTPTNGIIDPSHTGTTALWGRSRSGTTIYAGDVTVTCSDPSGAFDDYTETNMTGAG